MNILVIDDDVFFQKFYSTKLREAGYTVDIAADGEEGLEKIQKGSYTLILLDLVMPKVDGFELLRMRQNNKRMLAIPVIVFSTLGQQEDKMKAIQLGANDFMDKTFFNINSLMEKVKKMTG